MKCIKIISFLACMSAVTSFTSCSQKVSAQPVRDENRTFAASGKMGGRGGMSGSGNSAETMKITSENAVDLSLLTGDEKSLSEVQVEGTLYLNLSNLTYGQNSSASQVLAIGEKAELNENISLEAEVSDATGTYIKVTSEESAVKIVLSGTLEKGSVEIEPKKNSNLVLELNSASITSANYAPINVSKAASTYLVLNGNSTLTDGRVYGTGYSKSEGTDYYTASYTGTAEDGAELTEKWAQGKDTKGSLYTKGSLIISGNGSLDVNEGYKHGIYSKDYIHVISGTVNVTTTGRNCVRSQNGFVMEGGTLNLNGTGTHTNDQSRGIVVEGDEENPGEGFIYISGGNINIKTTGKAISAKWDIEEDAETESTSDDPNPVVVITGGTFNITTSGQVIEDEWSNNVTYHDVDGIEVTEKESCSPEGIEGKLGVVISGGNIVVNTTDDSINASRDGGAFVNVSGGTIYASSSRGDCIDSNGDINISGGTLVALSTLGSEDGFDCDGDLTFTGGVAAGISGASKSY
ncbi:MAG: carbohydrate-binding domain-containing protein, partial [Treponema sp.]|nr:carbohydrate-binding domain-containing protein [Treponema sp.]